MANDDDDALRDLAKLFALEHLGGTENPDHRKLVTELIILLRKVKNRELDFMRNHIRRREGTL